MSRQQLAQECGVPEEYEIQQVFQRYSLPSHEAGNVLVFNKGRANKSTPLIAAEKPKIKFHEPGIASTDSVPGNGLVLTTAKNS